MLDLHPAAPPTPATPIATPERVGRLEALPGGDGAAPRVHSVSPSSDSGAPSTGDVRTPSPDSGCSSSPSVQASR
eukprot:6246852-Pyramimonas_sp.AAC.1